MTIKYSDKLFTNEKWAALCDNVLVCGKKTPQYYELLGITFHLDTTKDCIASSNKKVFDYKKAEAMLYWYEKADKTDKSIIDYFPEYARCIDESHKEFNSNYGLYAKNGLKHCIKTLTSDYNTRQACFLINNNEAMSNKSIDKLCTNAVMFFIRNNTLQMIVQMRSSNLLTLLPYDAFIFCVWYKKVYDALVNTYCWAIKKGDIVLQIASLHAYISDAVDKINNADFIIEDTKEYVNFLKLLSYENK